MRNWIEYEVTWHYGVNKGTSVVKDVPSWHKRFESETGGPVKIDKVRQRMAVLVESEWEDVE